MAIAGSGGWIPSTLAVVAWNGELRMSGLTHNVPKAHVLQDMHTAADKLRSAPSTPVRVDVKKFVELRRIMEASTCK